MRKTNRPFHLPLLLAFVVACGEKAGSEVPTGVVAQGLANAPLDTNNPWAVGVCMGSVGNVPGDGVNVCMGGMCSASLIAPNLVLTAQHCLHKPNFQPTVCEGSHLPESRVPGAVRVTLSEAGRYGTPTWLDVDEMLFPQDTNFCDNDIALLILKENVPSSEAKPIDVALYRDLKVNPPSKLTAVSRGLLSIRYQPKPGAPSSEPYQVDYKAYDDGKGRRRILQDMEWRCYGGTPGCTLYDRATAELPNWIYTVPASQFLVSTGALSGDSGGAILDQAEYESGVPKVLGVHSWGGVDDSGMPVGGTYVSTAFHRDFILASAMQAAAKGGYPVPSWTESPGAKGDSGQPEPPSARDDDETSGCSASSSSSAWLVAFLVAMCWRRKLGTPEPIR